MHYVKGNGWSRREFLSTAALAGTGALLGFPSEPGAAEPPPAGKIYRLGYLFVGLQPPKEFLEAMGRLGYVEGKNLVFEFRSAEGKEERLPALAAELVRLNVDVIVAPGVLPAQAAKDATKTVPIVYTGGADPVAVGLAASWARPGGNVTGITEISHELTGKRLELLKEAFPKTSGLAVLVRVGGAGVTSQLKEIEVEAKALRLKPQSLEVRGASDFDKAFSTLAKNQSLSLIEVPNALFHANRKRIVELATQKRLPAIFHSRDFVDAGGLMCYGENTVETLRRLVIYVDKILKGRRDLPIEGPMRFEFVVNLKAAKQIGVTIAPNVLVRANEVIR